MKEVIFFCIVGLPLFGKEGSGTPVFKILVRALHFIIIIMFVKYVYDLNNDVWILKVGDDSYNLTGSGLKMVK